MKKINILIMTYSSADEILTICGILRKKFKKMKLDTDFNHYDYEDFHKTRDKMENYDLIFEKQIARVKTKVNRWIDLLAENKTEETYFNEIVEKSSIEIAQRAASINRKEITELT